MKRRVLMIALAIGAVGGLSVGIHRICHGPQHWKARHSQFQARVAETCVEAAHRIHEQKAVEAAPKGAR